MPRDSRCFLVLHLSGEIVLWKRDSAKVLSCILVGRLSPLLAKKHNLTHSESKSLFFSPAQSFAHPMLQVVWIILSKASLFGCLQRARTRVLFILFGFLESCFISDKTSACHPWLFFFRLPHQAKPVRGQPIIAAFKTKPGLGSRLSRYD